MKVCPLIEVWGEGEVGAAYPTAAEARVAAGARLRRALNSVPRDT